MLTRRDALQNAGAMAMTTAFATTALALSADSASAQQAPGKVK
jgi:hypothetical protein